MADAAKDPQRLAQRGSGCGRAALVARGDPVQMSTLPKVTPRPAPSGDRAEILA